MRFVTAIAAGTTALGLALPAFADAPYLCTGVGLKARTEAEAFGHSLRLVFAEPDGHLLADVNTRISDSNGNLVLQASCASPWLLVDLPEGSYTIESTFQGETTSQPVSVSGVAGQEQLISF